MTDSEQNESEDRTAQEDVLLDLRAEINEAADKAREKAEGSDMDEAAAAQHGMADAYEKVVHLIDNRLYGDGS